MNIYKRIIIHIPEIHKICRSLYFCLKYLPFRQAIKMPIFLNVPVKVCRLNKGSIKFEGDISHRQVEFVEGVAGFPALYTQLYVEPQSQLVFRGKAYVSRGCTIRVDCGGVLKIGKDFVTNKNTIIRCSNKITILDDVMVGWNNEINDNDGHYIYINGKQVERTAPICIGPHVWITSYVKIGKNVTIPEGCIIGKGAVVTKRHTSPHTLIAGVPARDIKSGINWER